MVVRLGATAGVAAPALLAVVFTVLTFHQQRFLEEIGWSAVERTEVEWPSVLLLGPGGRVESCAFLVTGFLGVVFALSLFLAVRSPLPRIGAGALAAMSTAVAFMAFEPDLPDTREPSWHDALHNGVYPVIPSASLVAAAIFAAGFRHDRRWRRQAFSSALFVPLAISALALATIDSIAQLARYFFFGSLLAGAAVLASGLFGHALDDGVTSSRSTPGFRCNTS